MAIAKTPLKTPEKKEGIFKQALSITWIQFSSTTSIHGLKHVNDPRGNRSTRCFWAFIPIFCFVCAIALMVTFLMRYKSNPTRINVETSFGPISDIEFPAISFCNPNFITDSQVMGLIRSLENTESLPDNKTDAEIMTQIKYTAGFTNPLKSFNESELYWLQDVLLENRFDVQLTMKKLMYPCSKLLFRCRWEGKVVDCRELFSATETYQGFCCGFNVNKPVGASVGNKVQTVRKTQYFGPEMGLSVILNPLIEKQAMTSVNSEGIKILVNQPSAYPSERTIERMLPHRQETYVEIRPERTDCSEAVRSLPLSDRGCVFSNEYELKFFPTYMEENCKVECNMQLHMKTCECLPYFFYNTKNVEVCNIKKIQCMVENRELLRNENSNNVSQSCKCPSNCDGQVYELRTSSSDLIPGMKTVIDPFHWNLTSQHMVVHVYYVSQVYRVFIRSLLTNFISLISNLGGVYSLLIGSSIISAIEIIYFYSIRLYANYVDVKTEDMKPKTFSQRLDNVNVSTLKVPRLDTAKSSVSDMSSLRMSAMSHF